MKKSILFLSVVLFLLPLAGTTFAGIPGATDKVTGASLLVPFFEVGIDKGQNPQDTLLTVVNTSSASSTIHYHVWDIDGNATDLFGNAELIALETWGVAMGDIIATASTETKNQLAAGTSGFYRGFVTIDLVSYSTRRDPTNSSFPFENSNCLEGFIYYVRLLQGSANGIDMIPLEYLSSSLDEYLSGFYRHVGGNGGGDREAITCDARLCAQTIIEGGICEGNWEIDRMDFRVFLDPAISGGSRIIIFMWDPDETESVSIYCDTTILCDSEYIYRRYDEAGNVEQDTTIRLDHMVNAIDVSGTENGWVSIWNIANPTYFQVYGFSFNSASSSSISTNWDAIFPAYIIP